MRPVAIVPLLFACCLAAPGAVTGTLTPAQEGLIESEERPVFDRLSKAEQAGLLRTLREARSCVKRYRSKDGAKDAKAAAALYDPRFLSGWVNGVAGYPTTPGIDGCSGSMRTPNKGFERLDDAYQGPPRTWALHRECSRLADRYAADFNHSLASARPELLRKACPRGSVAPTRPNAGRALAMDPHVAGEFVRRFRGATILSEADFMKAVAGGAFRIRELGSDIMIMNSGELFSPDGLYATGHRVIHIGRYAFERGILTIDCKGCPPTFMGFLGRIRIVFRQNGKLLMANADEGGRAVEYIPSYEAPG